jgi:septum formation protein
VEADHPVDCAGSYKIEGRGIVLFERIEADDFTAITGLPLLALTRILVELGVDVP